MAGARRGGRFSPWALLGVEADRNPPSGTGKIRLVERSAQTLPRLCVNKTTATVKGTMTHSHGKMRKLAAPTGLALMMALVVVAIPVVLVARVAMMPIKGLGEPK